LEYAGNAGHRSVAAMQRLKEAGSKGVGRRTGMPRAQKAEGRQI